MSNTESNTMNYENKHGTATLTYLNTQPADELCAEYALIKGFSKVTGKTSSTFANVRPSNANKAMAGKNRAACNRTGE